MKQIEKSEFGYWFQRMNAILTTDRNGKLKLRETADDLEETIRHLLGEVVDIKIIRSAK